MAGNQTIILAANETREIALGGEYFEIRSALYPVNLELIDRAGGVVCLVSQALQSDYVRPGRYETVRITNGATAQTVDFWYGNGDAGSRRFSGNVTGTVELGATTLATVTTANMSSGSRDILRTPLSNNGSYNNTSGLASNTPLTLFTPAANVNGAILLSAQMSDGAQASNQVYGFIAKASAPLSVNDGDPVLVAGSNVIISGAAYLQESLGIPQFIPAGLGLYYIHNVLSAATSTRTARWRLL